MKDNRLLEGMTVMDTGGSIDKRDTAVVPYCEIHSCVCTTNMFLHGLYKTTGAYTLFGKTCKSSPLSLFLFCCHCYVLQSKVMSHRCELQPRRAWRSSSRTPHVGPSVNLATNRKRNHLQTHTAVAISCIAGKKRGRQR